MDVLLDFLCNTSVNACYGLIVRNEKKKQK